MILPIIQVPDERLRRQCVPVTTFGPMLEDFAQSMGETRQQSKAVRKKRPRRIRTLYPGERFNGFVDPYVPSVNVGNADAKSALYRSLQKLDETLRRVVTPKFIRELVRIIRQ